VVIPIMPPPMPPPKPPSPMPTYNLPSGPKRTQPPLWLEKGWEMVMRVRAVMGLADTHGFDMPITRCVVGLIDQTLTITGAMAELLARPLKEE